MSLPPLKREIEQLKEKQKKLAGKSANSDPMPAAPSRTASPGALPLLEREKKQQKAWLARKRDDFMEQAVNEKRPWAVAGAIWAARRIALPVIRRLGKTYPFVLRPFERLSRAVHRHLDKKPDTTSTRFWKRFWGMKRPDDNKFRLRYAALNLGVAALAGLTVARGAYCWGTVADYPNVVVTQAEILPNKIESFGPVFAIHGYQCIDPDGKVSLSRNVSPEGRACAANQTKRDFYSELAWSFWHADFMPEYIYGQIPVYGRCDIKTYGAILRVPVISSSGLLRINPMTYSADCTVPTIISGSSPSNAEHSELSQPQVSQAHLAAAAPVRSWSAGLPLGKSRIALG